MTYKNVNTSYYKNRMIKLDCLPVRAVYVAKPGWATTVSQTGSDAEFRFERTYPAAPLQQHDIYSLRDEFLSVKNPKQAEELFAKYGAFTETPVGELEVAATPAAPPLMFSDLTALQEMIRIMSIAVCRDVDAASFRKQYDTPGRLKDWSWQLLHALPISVVEQAGVPVASIERHSFFGALLSAVYLDVLRGAENRLCARRDCGLVFEKTDPRKLYCTTACARLATVRAFRERKRELRKQNLTSKAKGSGQ